jgi:hypothetical protein
MDNLEQSLKELSRNYQEMSVINLAREASFNNLTPVSKAHVESQPKRFADQMFLYYTILKVVNT